MNNRSISGFWLLTVWLLVLLVPFCLQGKHIIGGEMTYRFLEDLGNGVKRFEFTLVIFRDCDSGGGQLDNPGRIGIYRGNAGGATLFSSFSVTLQGPESVSPVIPSCADASAVSNACTQRGVYVFTRDLPVTTTQSYFIVYQRCCRTEQILNIINPGSTGGTYVVELTPLAQTLNNSSPVFLNYPPTFICNNFNLSFNHSAVDMEGDSLVYRFCAPYDGGGQGGGGGGGGGNCNSPQPNPPCGPPFDVVNFAGSYSVSAPMGGNPVISIDPATGFLQGRPNTLGQYVVGICVEEYRNGQLLSTILRDFQFNVVDCTPTVAAVVSASAVTGPKTFEVARCGETFVTILNQSQQNADLKTWEWEVDLGNGTLFTANTWHLTVPLPAYGVYPVRLYLNRNELCRDTAFITLFAYPGVAAGFDYSYDICTEGPVMITNTSVSGAAGGIPTTQWVVSPLGDTLNGNISGYQFPAYGAYTIKQTVVDADGCKAELVKTIDWQPKLAPLIPAAGNMNVCLPDPVLFRVLDTVNVSGCTIFWDFGDGTAPVSSKTPVHYYEAGAYNPYVRITNAYNCVSTAIFPNVRVFPGVQPNFGFAWDVCTEGPVLFTDSTSTGAAGGIIGLRWIIQPVGDTLYGPLGAYQFDDYGSYQVRLTASDADGCVEEYTQTVDWQPRVPPLIPPMKLVQVCHPSPVTFDVLEGVDLTGCTVVWNFGDGSQPVNDPFPVHAYLPGTFSPSVVITTAIDCVSRDSFTDRVITGYKPVADFNYTPERLSNIDSEVQFANLSDSTVVRWEWEFGTAGRSGLENPQFTFLADTGLVVVTLFVENSQGCQDTVSRELDVVPTLRLYIPNIFAPLTGSSTGNERFGVLGIIPGYQSFDLKIYNRWGAQVFASDSPEALWNGRMQNSGDLLPPGVYVYQLNMVGPRSEPVKVSGTVTLY